MWTTPCQRQHQRQRNIRRPYFTALLVGFYSLRSTLAESDIADRYRNNPGDFFFESFPSLSFTDGAFHLTMNTPLPVLCAVHYGLDGVLFDDVTTMEMSSPAENHDVILPLEGGSNYTVLLTAFLPGGFRNMLRSSPYLAVAKTSTSGTALILNEMAGNPYSPDPTTEIPACSFYLSVESVESTTASFLLSSLPNLPTVHSIAYRLNGGKGETGDKFFLSRYGSNRAQVEPKLSLEGLHSSTTYSAVFCFVDTAADFCCTPNVGSKLTFTTRAEVDAGINSGGEGTPEECVGENVALSSMGASVFDASSTWGHGGPASSFGVNKAIDGQPGTQWSSHLDGNDAYIAVKIQRPASIAGVGVWSRSMRNGTAKILSFRLMFARSDGSGTTVTLGPYDLESTRKMYRYDVGSETSMSGEQFDVVKLEVVESTGGNTGLRSLEVYPLRDACRTSAESLFRNAVRQGGP